MVFYFSGTGNSKFVATTIANFLGEALYFIPETDPFSLDCSGERVVFIFPVYSWGVPPLIEKFVSSLPDYFWDKVMKNQSPIDCVMTCGDEVALAPEMFRKILQKRGLPLNSVWSVIMPNNYVLLPGFDVDPMAVEKRKLEACKGRIMEVAQGLSTGMQTVDVTRGSIPGLKTRLVYPLFKKWGIFPKKWHYLPSCVGCGKCAAMCPLVNVKMENGHPEWGSRCCSCLACYHICPAHAVAYGKQTRRKGQYFLFGEKSFKKT